MLLPATHTTPFAAESPQPAPASLPLGVDWAGEYGFAMYNGDPKQRCKVLDQQFAERAAHNITAIWLTHTSVADAAGIACLAGQHGIPLVASRGELALKVAGTKDESHLTAVRVGLGRRSRRR